MKTELINIQNCPFNPNHLLSAVKGVLNDAKLEVDEECLATLVQETVEEYGDWEEGQEFGTSDMTFAVKSCVDDVIHNFFEGKYCTEFNPTLKIVNYD